MNKNSHNSSSNFIALALVKWICWHIILHTHYSVHQEWYLQHYWMQKSNQVGISTWWWTAHWITQHEADPKHGWNSSLLIVGGASVFCTSLHLMGNLGIGRTSHWSSLVAACSQCYIQHHYPSPKGLLQTLLFWLKICNYDAPDSAQWTKLQRLRSQGGINC